MMNAYILPLPDSASTLETVGGKGLSLAKMIRAGLPVPDGFHITTAAYRAFVAANALQPRILAALEEAGAAQPAGSVAGSAGLNAASAAIGALFAQGSLPPELAAEITSAYNRLGEGLPVAVRSSATAEDLPEASFAGQQDTFLNIRGEQAVLEAVKKCWSSLWTARAIAYRGKQGIDPGSVALAVVVQEMVPAEAAGVLFTANPVSGRRDELVINAAWGLGEAVVSGLVTPDSILAEKDTGRIKSLRVGEKTTQTVAAETGTTQQPLTGARRKAQVLDTAQVAELASIARQVEDFSGSPQDIEWCQAGGRFFIVQSRPITTLAELPVSAAEVAVPTEWKLPKGSYAAVRNNIVELMADPLSPLFATMGVGAINTSLQRFMDGSFGMSGILPSQAIIVVNQYAYNNGSISAKSLARVTFGAGRILRKMFTGAVERWTESACPRYQQVVAAWQARDWQSLSTVELVESARQLTEAAIEAYAALVSGVIPAAWISEAIFTHLYNRLIRRRGDPPAPTFLLGFDSLPIRADRALFHLAECTRPYHDLAQVLTRLPAAQIAARLKDDSCPEGADSDLWLKWSGCFRQYLARFGYAIYDLDFMHPVAADDPTAAVEAFKLYLRGQGVNPIQRQQASVERREQAIQAVRGRLRGARLNWFNRALATAQKYAPLRENGLAEIGLAYPLIRQMLVEVGSRLAGQGVITAAEDIHWLTEDEVLSAAERIDAGHSMPPLAEQVRQRKAMHQAALRVTPPLALPQMKVFGFDLMSLKQKGRRVRKGALVKGVAASPGTVSGTARVIHGPEDFSLMQPGDVLVAPITTPAWTPLFALASAVVTDVGGPLSHGSIVAREYGIPAVLGTGLATKRIHSGQTVTVDGRAGTVRIHQNGGELDANT